MVTADDSRLLFQETFDAGLQAFQQEGIANITALKDQLLAAKHIQSKAIEARHASLMKRWSQLLANSATRKKKLLEAQSHFRKVRVGRPGSGDPSSTCQALRPFGTEVLHKGVASASTKAVSSLPCECHSETPGRLSSPRPGEGWQGRQVGVGEGSHASPCRLNPGARELPCRSCPAPAARPRDVQLVAVVTPSPLLSGGGPLPDLCQKGFCLQQLV